MAWLTNQFLFISNRLVVAAMGGLVGDADKVKNKVV
jgi:hypothetical protein